MTANLKNKIRLISLFVVITFVALFGIGAALNLLSETAQDKRAKKVTKDFKAWMTYQAIGDGENFCARLTPKDIKVIEEEEEEAVKGTKEKPLSCPEIYSNTLISEAQKKEKRELNSLALKTLKVTDAKQSNKDWIIDYTVLREDLVIDKRDGKKVDEKQVTSHRVKAYPNSKVGWLFEDITQKEKLSVG